MNGDVCDAELFELFSKVFHLNLMSLAGSTLKAIRFERKSRLHSITSNLICNDSHGIRIIKFHQIAIFSSPNLRRNLVWVYGYRITEDGDRTAKNCVCMKIFESAHDAILSNIIDNRITWAIAYSLSVYPLIKFGFLHVLSYRPPRYVNDKIL